MVVRDDTNKGHLFILFFVYCRPSILVSDILWEYDEPQMLTLPHQLLRRKENSSGILIISLQNNRCLQFFFSIRAIDYNLIIRKFTCALIMGLRPFEDRRGAGMNV